MPRDMKRTSRIQECKTPNESSCGSVGREGKSILKRRQRKPLQEVVDLHLTEDVNISRPTNRRVSFAVSEVKEFRQPANEGTLWGNSYTYDIQKSSSESENTGSSASDFHTLSSGSCGPELIYSQHVVVEETVSVTFSQINENGDFIEDSTSNTPQLNHVCELVDVGNQTDESCFQQLNESRQHYDICREVIVPEQNLQSVNNVNKLFNPCEMLGEFLKSEVNSRKTNDKETFKCQTKAEIFPESRVSGQMDTVHKITNCMDINTQNENLIINLSVPTRMTHKHLSSSHEDFITAKRQKVGSGSEGNLLHEWLKGGSGKAPEVDKMQPPYAGINSWSHSSIQNGNISDSNIRSFMTTVPTALNLSTVNTDVCDSDCRSAVTEIPTTTQQRQFHNIDSLKKKNRNMSHCLHITEQPKHSALNYQIYTDPNICKGAHKGKCEFNELSLDLSVSSISSVNKGEKDGNSQTKENEVLNASDNDMSFTLSNAPLLSVTEVVGTTGTSINNLENYRSALDLENLKITSTALATKEKGTLKADVSSKTNSFMGSMSFAVSSHHHLNDVNVERRVSPTMPEGRILGNEATAASETTCHENNSECLSISLGSQNLDYNKTSLNHIPCSKNVRGSMSPTLAGGKILNINEVTSISHISGFGNVSGSVSPTVTGRILENIHTLSYNTSRGCSERSASPRIAGRILSNNESASDDITGSGSASDVLPTSVGGRILDNNEACTSLVTDVRNASGNVSLTMSGGQILDKNETDSRLLNYFVSERSMSPTMARGRIIDDFQASRSVSNSGNIKGRCLSPTMPGENNFGNSETESSSHITSIQNASGKSLSPTIDGGRILFNSEIVPSNNVIDFQNVSGRSVSPTLAGGRILDNTQSPESYITNLKNVSGDVSSTMVGGRILGNTSALCYSTGFANINVSSTMVGGRILDNIQTSDHVTGVGNVIKNVSPAKTEGGIGDRNEMTLNHNTGFPNVSEKSVSPAMVGGRILDNEAIPLSHVSVLQSDNKGVSEELILDRMQVSRTNSAAERKESPKAVTVKTLDTTPPRESKPLEIPNACNENLSPSIAKGKKLVFPEDDSRETKVINNGGLYFVDEKTPGNSMKKYIDKNRNQSSCTTGSETSSDGYVSLTAAHGKTCDTNEANLTGKQIIRTKGKSLHTCSTTKCTESICCTEVLTTSAHTNFCDEKSLQMCNKNSYTNVTCNSVSPIVLGSHSLDREKCRFSDGKNVMGNNVLQNASKEKFEVSVTKSSLENSPWIDDQCSSNMSLMTIKQEDSYECRNVQNTHYKANNSAFTSSDIGNVVITGNNEQDSTEKKEIGNSTSANEKKIDCSATKTNQILTSLDRRENTVPMFHTDETSRIEDADVCCENNEKDSFEQKERGHVMTCAAEENTDYSVTKTDQMWKSASSSELIPAVSGDKTNMIEAMEEDYENNGTDSEIENKERGNSTCADEQNTYYPATKTNLILNSIKKRENTILGFSGDKTNGTEGVEVSFKKNDHNDLNNIDIIGKGEIGDCKCPVESHDEYTAKGAEVEKHVHNGSSPVHIKTNFNPSNNTRYKTEQNYQKDLMNTCCETNFESVCVDDDDDDEDEEEEDSIERDVPCSDVDDALKEAVNVIDSDFRLDLVSPPIHFLRPGQAAVEEKGKDSAIARSKVVVAKDGESKTEETDISGTEYANNFISKNVLTCDKYNHNIEDVHVSQFTHDENPSICVAEKEGNEKIGNVINFQSMSKMKRPSICISGIDYIDWKSSMDVTDTKVNSKDENNIDIMLPITEERLPNLLTPTAENESKAGSNYSDEFESSDCASKSSFIDIDDVQDEFDRANDNVGDLIKSFRSLGREDLLKEGVNSFSLHCEMSLKTHKSNNETISPEKSIVNVQQEQPENELLDAAGNSIETHIESDIQHTETLPPVSQALPVLSEDHLQCDVNSFVKPKDHDLKSPTSGSAVNVPAIMQSKDCSETICCTNKNPSEIIAKSHIVVDKSVSSQINQEANSILVLPRDVEKDGQVEADRVHEQARSSADLKRASLENSIGKRDSPIQKKRRLFPASAPFNSTLTSNCALSLSKGGQQSLNIPLTESNQNKVFASEDGRNTTISSNLRPPISVDKWIEEQQESKKCSWKIEVVSPLKMNFYFMERNVQFLVEIEPCNLNIKEIKIVSHLKGNNMKSFMHNLFLNKLKLETMKDRFPSKDDIPALIDFICAQEDFVLDFCQDWLDLEIKHDVKMKENSCVEFEVTSLVLLWLCTIKIDLSTWDGERLHSRYVEVHPYIGEINDADIKRLMRAIQGGPRLLKDYIDHLSDYIQLKERLHGNQFSLLE